MKTSRCATSPVGFFRLHCSHLSGRAQSEISILSSLDSPFVTKYEGSWLRGTELWIVMEYLAGGSCGDLLKPGTFKEDYIAIILRELLKGLEYLHEEGKLHRDIKGGSCLLYTSPSPRDS